MSGGRIVVYFLRRDLRIADNAILHVLSVARDYHGYTYLLPVYVLPPDQVEISGLLKDGKTSPYPQARANVSKYWKCGIHRVKFLAESVWDLKENLEYLESGLIIRAGRFQDVLRNIVVHYAGHKESPQVAAVWMTKGSSLEEVREEQEISSACFDLGVKYVPFRDRRAFIDK